MLPKIVWILFVFCLVHLVPVNSFESDSLGESEGFVICRQCGRDLFEPNHIFTFTSPGSIQSNNNTLIGSARRQVQLLRNPHGYEFEVITVRSSACARQGDWHSSHTWFPGYSWQICRCPKCGAHIGWLFKRLDAGDEEEDSSFFGVRVDQIIEETAISQLLVSPRTYRA